MDQSGRIIRIPPGAPPVQNTTSVTVPGVASNPATVQGPGAGDVAAPTSITNDLTIDLSGSTFTGSAEENADAIGNAVRDILSDEQTVGAFQAGVG